MNTMRTLRQHHFLAIALSAALLSACSSMSYAASSEPATKKDGILVSKNGMTLYTFDKDSDGKSACNGQCATNWPPLLAADGETGGGDYAVIKRDDGKMQYTYEGKPLYFWVKDQKPGDKTGDGVGGVWHVAD